MQLTSEMIVDLLLNIVNILVLFAVVRFLLYKPVKKFLSARTARIEKEKTEVEEKEAAVREQAEKYEVLLKQSEHAKAEAAQSGEALGREEAAKIVAAANSKASAILAEASQKTQAEHQKMLENAEDEIAALALRVSEKLLSREITDADNQRIVREFLSGGKQGD